MPINNLTRTAVFIAYLVHFWIKNRSPSQDSIVKIILRIQTLAVQARQEFTGVVKGESSVVLNRPDNRPNPVNIQCWNLVSKCKQGKAWDSSAISFMSGAYDRYH